MSAVVDRRPRWASREALDPPTVAFAALIVLAGVLIMVETRGLSFYADEWDFLLDRRGLSAHTLLTPHGPHLVVLPILIYKLLLAVFGSSSYVPFRALAALDLMAPTCLVGVICRRRWGPWWGLVPVVVLVTLGPGYTTLLSPFQVCYALAVSGGLTAFVALRWRTRRGDMIACAALIVSLASVSSGVGFAVGAAVVLVIAGGWRRRAWVVVAPAVLYGLWYLSYGHKYSESQLSLWHTALVYTIDGLGATAAGLLALTGVQGGLLDPTLGLPIVLGAFAAMVAFGARGWRPQEMFWPAAATLLTLFVAAALSNTSRYPRPYNDPRYLSSNGALLLICVCTALPRPRLTRGMALFVAAVVAVIAATNLYQYGPGRSALATAVQYTRAQTGTLLVMRGVASPQFDPYVPGAPGQIFGISAATFFHGVDADGDFDADSVAELGSAPEPVRLVIDRELQLGEQLTLAPGAAFPADATAPPASVLSGTIGRSGSCLVLHSPAGFIAAPPGDYSFTAAPATKLTMAMGRFATGYGVDPGVVPTGTSARLRIPADGAPDVPWRIELSGLGARVCRAQR